MYVRQLKEDIKDLAVVYVGCTLALSCVSFAVVCNVRHKPAL